MAERTRTNRRDLTSRSIAREFEEIVQELLKLNGFRVTDLTSAEKQRSFDFQAIRDNSVYAVEVKHYRTERAQPSLLQAAALQLLNALARGGLSKGMLIASCTLYPELREGLENRFGLVFVDRTDLFIWGAKDPELATRLASLLEDNEPPRPKPTEDRPIDKIVLDADYNARTDLACPDVMGTALCNDLRRLKRGRASWPRFENVCERVLRYLFANDLHGWHKQSRTDDGLNRFDFVCRVRPTTEFWNFVLHHLESRYVLFEFKNYVGQIKQGQVLTTEKYLFARGLRRAGIILSRKGAERGAIAMMQGAMREQGKLMLVVSDDDVCEMLHMKERGEDPSDYLFDLADDFLLSLPR